jgi:hypothetical protein
MWVPPGRTQQQHRKWLEAQIKWLPQGKDSQKPLAPKPPLTTKTLRMLVLITAVDKLLLRQTPNG